MVVTNISLASNDAAYIFARMVGWQARTQPVVRFEDHVIGENWCGRPISCLQSFEALGCYGLSIDH